MPKEFGPTKTKMLDLRGLTDEEVIDKRNRAVDALKARGCLVFTSHLGIDACKITYAEFERFVDDIHTEKKGGN